MRARTVLVLALATTLAHCEADNPVTRPALDAKMKCAREGREWLSKLETQQGPLGVAISRGQFGYNKRLDTCLCYYHASYRGSVTTKVTDILSERDILTFTTGAGANGVPTIIGRDERAGAAPIREIDDFDARVRKLGFEP
jgi:hypothetical protein